MDIGKKSQLSNIHKTFIDDTAITSLSNCRDLGVTFDNKLNFGMHMHELVIKAKQRMSLLLRSFKTKEPAYLMIGFKSYILPIVDYCSQIWSPHYVQDILLLESVQRNYTKRIPCLTDMTYADRLAFLKISTLERRRLEADLIFCYKILHGLIAGPPEKYGLKLSKRKSRGHSLKLSTDLAKLDARKFFFCNRVCSPWNSLSEELVSSKNTKLFKEKPQLLNLNAFLIIKGQGKRSTA